MALTRTSRLGQITGATGFFGTGAFTTNSFTPSDSSLLVVGASVQQHQAGGDYSSSLTISDSVGLTWTPRVNVGAGTDFGTAARIWTAPVSSGASMTVTLDCGAIDIAWYLASIIDYTGYDTGSPVGVSGSAIRTSGFGTPDVATITLGGTPASTSEIFGAIAADKGSPQAIVHGSGNTELYDIANTDWGDGESQVRPAGSASTSLIWDDVRNTAASLFDWAAVAIEIKEATAPPPNQPAIPHFTSRGSGQLWR